jgi:uncharacterized protein
MHIEVRKLSEHEMQKLNIKSWPVWEKGISSFEWYYDMKESCFFLEGEVEIETEDGKRTEIKKGDFVTFPQGLKCKWCIKKDVRKYYNFS